MEEKWRGLRKADHQIFHINIPRNIFVTWQAHDIIFISKGEISSFLFQSAELNSNTLGLAMKVMWRNAIHTAYWLCCCWGSHTFCNLTIIHWINHMWEFELYNTTNTTELKYLKSLLISASEAGFPSFWWVSAIWVKGGNMLQITPLHPHPSENQKGLWSTPTVSIVCDVGIICSKTFVVP